MTQQLHQDISLAKDAAEKSMRRFYIHTLGCKVNRVESDSIAAALLSQGWTQDTPENSDICIINTCTVTGEADAKNRKTIRNLLKRCECPILVTGCAINIAPDYYADISLRIHVEKDKPLVPQRANELMGLDDFSPLPHDQAEAALREFDRTGDGFRTRATVKIQDGCNNACTYCIVHVARGRAVSTPAPVILEEAQRLADHGAEEIMLVGIDSAAYSYDGMKLSGLVQLLLEKTTVSRFRLGSIEPQSITPDIARVMADANGRICRHLHLSLQSGSTKVLREMNRKYTAEEFVQLVQGLRAACPQLALSTDIIVGFPGETDEDFQMSCQIAEQCQFMRLHVFRYSKRPGTPAAEREDQIDPAVSAERAATLRALGKRLALEDMQRRVGTEELVIVERTGRATSESYHEVAVPADLQPGALVRARLTGVNSDGNFTADILND